MSKRPTSYDLVSISHLVSSDTYSSRYVQVFGLLIGRKENPSLTFELRSPSAKKTPASDRDSQLNSEAIVAETVEPIALGTQPLGTQPLATQPLKAKSPAREVVLAWQYGSRVADAERSIAKQVENQVGSYVRIRLHVHK
jgi:hypothetical protein